MDVDTGYATEDTIMVPSDGEDIPAPTTKSVEPSIKEADTESAPTGPEDIKKKKRKTTSSVWEHYSKEGTGEFFLNNNKTGHYID